MSELERARILFVNHTSTMGGGEIALLALAKELAARSSIYSVLLLEEGPLVTELSRLMMVHVLPLNRALLETRRTSLGSLSMIRASLLLPIYVLRIARLIRRLNITLVHTNSLKAALIGGFAARLGGAKVLWHIRDRIASDYLPHRTALIILKLARVVPTAIITNSQATLSSLGLAEQTRRRPLTRVIHDGLALSKFSKPSLAHDGIVVGILGRISPWKGQDVFIRAAAMVHARHPDIRFRIIGSPMFGEEEYALHITDLVTSLRLTSIVEFHGFIEDTASALSELDVLVHASTIGEPFGQVIIEGMASGKPVIATAGGGVLEIIQNGETGLLVPMGDVEALAGAMLTLIGNSSLRMDLGRRGRLRVEQCFRIEQVADKVEAFHSEIAAVTSF